MHQVRISPPPEQGQIVRVRHKVWAVTNIQLTKTKDSEVNKVVLECLSDDSLGREIQVIWEREIAPTKLDSTQLPSLDSLDDPELLQTFLTALRWSSASLAEGDIMQAPFRGGVQIEEFQLAPVVRAINMPRVRLLIADDVGLGKTIEAGLIVQELIHSHRASRILVICPAHLKLKWADEMADKFGMEFRIIDRDAIIQMRREFGPTINPWATFPRLITSIDYIKTEHPKRLFEALSDRRREESRSSKPWDILILDEAHNVAPSGRKKYIYDSDRTLLMRTIAEHFEHKIFLTATPHNGYRESFTGLLEILDNLRFSRGTELDQKQLSAITIRRLKDDIKDKNGKRVFPIRVIKPRDAIQDPELYIDLTREEQKLFDYLQKYQDSLQDKVGTTNRPTEFVLTLLRKRALSSPLAIRESLLTHMDTIGIKDEMEIGDSLFKKLEQKDEQDWSDDEEKEENLKAATREASRLCRDISDEEKSWLQSMYNIADSFVNAHPKVPDSKARALIEWIRKNLQENGKWTGERVIIFTEYVHTLKYLQEILEQEDMGNAIRIIIGGMNDNDRQAINDEFQSPPDETSVRILLATDAASEGADFQKHCRNLIHYEIPWNPVRMEQRNGRVDRHGQRAKEVYIHHFVYRNQEDSQFLETIVKKVEQIRTDLGSVGPVIADSIRRKALRRRVDLNQIDNDARLAIARSEFDIKPQESDNAKKLAEALNKSRETLGVSDEAQLDLITRALELEGFKDGIEINDDGTFNITALPPSWRECGRYKSTNDHRKLLTFDREKARDNDSLNIVHLDHPIMRRAIASFRMRMWSTGNGTPIVLHRASIETCDSISSPVLVGWGRLVILGPEHNRLHEGLVKIGVEINIGSLNILDDETQKSILSGLKVAYTQPTTSVADIVNPLIEDLGHLLIEQGEKKAAELEETLKIRGDQARRHARDLATERMRDIRTTIRQLEKKMEDPQLRLGFDTDEEFIQFERDFAALQARLSELEVERETESKRQQDLYKVAVQRVYPVALQVFVPGEVRS